MKKLISILLIVSCLASISFAEPYDNGYLKGKQEARVEYNAGGWVIGGFLLGFSMGILGTGLGYVIAGGEVETPIIRGNSEYKMGYERGYQRTARSKNQGTELVSSLIGMVLLCACL